MPVSNNLVQEAKEDKLIAYFIGLAKKSFEQEKKFYSIVGIEKSENMPQSLVDEYEKLTNKDSFKKYQDNLADTVYGKDTHFIKYFYDEKFISALSGKAASVDSVLNNLEKDLAAYAIAMSGEQTDITVVGEKTSLEKSITIYYLFGTDKDEKSIEISGKTLEDKFEQKKKAIKPQELKTFIAEQIMEKEGNVKSRVNLNPSNKEIIPNLLNAINNFILGLKETSGEVTQKGRGYYITRNIEFGNKIGISLGEALFGSYGEPLPETIDEAFKIKGGRNLLKNKDMPTYSQILNDPKKSVANDIVRALNDTLLRENVIQSLSETEINTKMALLIRYLIEGMFTNGKANISIEGAVSSNNKNYRKKNEIKMFELNFGSPNLEEILKEGEYTIKLRGGEEMFKTLFSGSFKTELARQLKTEQVSGEKNQLICGVKIIAEDKNLFFNKIDNSINIDNYKKEVITNKKKKGIDDSAKLEKDAEEVSAAFSMVISSVIGEIGSAEDSELFQKWWGTEGKNDMSSALKQLIINNPTQIYEILSKKDKKQVAGMIGETVFGAIVMRKMKNSGDPIVQMLGQTSHGNGEAAVDLNIVDVKALENSGQLFTSDKLDSEVLKKKRLTSVGFQIKNYTSAGENSEILYRTTNKLLSDTSTMKRYLQDTFLGYIQEQLTQDNEVFFQGGTKDEQDKELKKIGNILAYHIPYFMRYDEAQMEQNTFGIEQNNFYIVNFKFVPSSMLFFLMAKSIAIEKDKVPLGEQYFYFSAYENKSERNARHEQGIDKNNNRNFLPSYYNFRDSFKTPQSDNLVSWHHDRLAINFTGVKVNFGKEFDKIVNKTTR